MADEQWRHDLVKAFARFDADGNGAIDRQEFEALLDALGSPMTAKDREIGFNLIDENGDGTISLEELAGWWGIVREEGTAS